MILNKKPLYGDIFCFSLTSGFSQKKAAAFVPVHAKLTMPIFNKVRIIFLYMYYTVFKLSFCLLSIKFVSLNTVFCKPQPR